MKLFYQIIFLFLSTTFFSQSVVSGRIVQINNNPISSATVILKNKDGQTVSFFLTDDSGIFEITTDEIGSFSLSVNSLGYESVEKKIQIEKVNQKIKCDFKLDNKVFEINEVIIDQEKKNIRIKQDTIVFNAKAFLQGNEQVVEDLLKKIPGIDIDDNGTIRVGNQEVEKIMIEGDDFFEKGYRLISKNMPVSPIEKVELYKNYSNNKHLKGVESSEKIALNLTLKKDSKQIWFGNILAGLGLFSENRYELKGNLMNFGKKNKHYFLANLNNLGVDVTGDIDHLIRPSRFGEPGSIGDDQSVNKLLEIGSQLPALKQNRINFNNAEVVSLNSIFTLSKKIKIKTLGFLNTDENDFYRNNYEFFSLGKISFENREDFTGRKKQITGFGKLDFVYDISATKSLEFTGKYNRAHEKNRSNLVFNNELLNENLITDNQLVDQKLVFTNKVKESRVFLISGRFISEKSPQNYTVNQFVFDELFSEDANNTKQLSENQMYFAGVEGHLLEKFKKGDLFELKAGSQWRKDYLKSQFELFRNSSSLSFPPYFQNNLSYSTNDTYISGKYHFNIKKYTFFAQSDFHHFYRKLNDYDVTSDQSGFFVVPKVGLEWKINEKNNITASYSYNTTNVGVLDVYSGYVQTGFRSFLKGAEGFNLLEASNTSLNYTFGNWGDKCFYNIYFSYTKNNDFYSTNSVIAQNYSITDKVLIKDRDILMLSSSFDYYFRFFKSNLKILLGGSKSNFKNIVNNSELREVANLNMNYGFELRSAFKGSLNYHLGSKWNSSKIKTEIENQFTNNVSFLDINFNVNKRFNVQLKSERYYFGNLEKENNQYFFMDLEAKYTFKENKLTFFLSGNNLLNTKKFKNYFISDVNISKTEYRLLPRYLLLKAEYRF